MDTVNYGRNKFYDTGPRLSSPSARVLRKDDGGLKRASLFSCRLELGLYDKPDVSGRRPDPAAVVNNLSSSPSTRRRAWDTPQGTIIPHCQQYGCKALTPPVSLKITLNLLQNCKKLKILVINSYCLARSLLWIDILCCPLTYTWESFGQIFKISGILFTF
jgi:hypothetical protein